jgi:hypothetical protein
MKQALEALEEYQANGAPFMSCDAAVLALRAAIAEASMQRLTDVQQEIETAVAEREGCGMNKKEVIKMAREAGTERSCINDEVWMLALAETGFEKFAELAFAAGAAAERERREFELAECYRCGWDGGAKAERDACARLCEEEKALRLAEMIQARGEK